jgi:hypothetical protein
LGEIESFQCGKWKKMFDCSGKSSGEIELQDRIDDEFDKNEDWRIFSCFC